MHHFVLVNEFIARAAVINYNAGSGITGKAVSGRQNRLPKGGRKGTVHLGLFAL